MKPPSAWWWLLSPVMYVLRRRWNKEFRQATLAQLTETQHARHSVGGEPAPAAEQR
jgi:hypothetical protein